MRLLVVAALLLTCLPVGRAQTPPARVVAIGDIHGAYDEFTLILKRAGLVDDKLAWSGGRTTLVQTGDYTDRGVGVRKVLDLLIRLEREARSAGGQVVTLLGNHEVMNLIGDWRDVTPEICATFATPDSDKLREEAFKQLSRLSPSGDAPTAVYRQSHDDFMLENPPGCIEYREAMGPSGVYGRWLRDKPIAAQLGDTLFMHAGLNPGRAAPRSVSDVTDVAQREIRRVDSHRQRLTRRRLALPSFTLQEVLAVSAAELRYATLALAAAKADGTRPPPLDVALLRESQELMDIATWLVVDPEGPLWFRGYAQWSEAEAAPKVFAFLDSLKLARIVVGHTPTTDRRIAPRFGGRVMVIDTGMLKWFFRGTPAALEFSGDTITAIYPDESVRLSGAPATPAPGTPSHSRPRS
jgi:hypothetical protein